MSSEQMQPKILIVDDNRDNLHILMALLKKEFAIVTAPNGETALEIAATAPMPDLILLDIMMPDMDGYEVCTRLKAQEPTKDIPVIFVTGVTEIMDETRAFELGAVDYITKPVHPPVVKARIKTHLDLMLYRRRLEERVRDRTTELESAKKAAESANETKNRFIANMSHELRTPMNGIIASAELALGHELPPKVVNILQTLKASAQSLQKVIGNILDFSESTNGRLRLKGIAFRLDDILQKLSGRYRHKSVEQSIRIEFEIPQSDVPNALLGDPERLEEVFRHLLDNAAKFSENEAQAVIEINVLESSREIVCLYFRIKDQGIGIDPEYQETIFQPFTQADASTTRRYDGTGMGLSLCKCLVELMNGKIWVESTPGKGSIFNFTAVFGRQDREIPFVMPDPEQAEDLYGNFADADLAQVTPPENLDKLRPELEKLASALSEMNFDGITRRIEAVEAHLNAPWVRELRRQIDAYEYDEALEYLKKIGAALDIRFI